MKNLKELPNLKEICGLKSVKNHMNKKGIFIISLDVELFWGTMFSKSFEEYKKNSFAVRNFIPEILRLFSDYNIHATWACVGFLFFQSKQEIFESLPKTHPSYSNKRLSSYDEINNAGENEVQDPWHLAPSLVKLITSSPNQELATHTFSHYYCLENGQNKNIFKEDLMAAIKIAQKNDIALRSIIFPANQVNEKYLSICKDMGLIAYRGNETAWFYKETLRENDLFSRRVLRMIDSYFNISGYNTYSIEGMLNSSLINIPASHFLRPYSNTLRILEPLKLRRVLGGLEYAAKNNLIYHLWWHPHYFGQNPEKNLLILEEILKHFLYLQKKYGMQSLNMQELARDVQTPH